MYICESNFAVGTTYRVDYVGKTVWFQIPIPSEILPTFEQGMKYMMAPQKNLSQTLKLFPSCFAYHMA